MDRSQTSAIVGVDGGGTSTKAIAVDLDGNLIGTGSAGPSNPNNTSYEAAASNILAAIDNVIVDNSNSIVSLCLGIAGVATPTHRTFLKTALLSQRPTLASTNLTITHDLEIAHQATFGDNPGIILIAGTGSSTYAHDTNGEIHRISGRSYKHHEDPGSGYAIGKQAIKANLLPPTKSRQNIATLAPQVIQLAEAGNHVAQGILKMEAYHLIKLLKSMPAVLPISFIGSTIELDTLYRTILIEELQKQFDHAKLITSKNPPAFGALQIAWKPIGTKPLQYSKFTKATP